MLVRVLTEYLEPAQYGELALGLTIAGLVNQIVMGGIGAGISRFYSIAAEKGDLWGYLKASRLLMSYATLVAGFIAIILMTGLYWSGQSHWLGLVAVVVVFSVLGGFNSSMNAMQNAARQRSVVALHTGMDAWLKIGLAVGVMLWFGISSVAVVVGYTLSALIITSSQLIFLRRLLGPKTARYPDAENENWERQMWAYSWPFSLWGALGWLQQASPRWALEIFSGTESLGYFAVVMQLGYSTILLATSMAISLLQPIVFARAGDAKSDVRVHSMNLALAKLELAALILTGAFFLITIFYHDLIFQILVDARYQWTSRYLPWLVIAGGVFATAQLLATKRMATLQPRRLLVSSIGSSVIGIFLAFVGAHFYGLTGVVLSLIVHAFSYYVMLIVTDSTEASNLSQRGQSAISP